MTEHPGESGRHNNAHGREQDCFCRNGLCLIPVRSETAVEHDEDQRYGADLFCEGVIVERDFENAIRAERHTEQDECQQGRDAETVGYFVQKNAGKNYDCGYK